MGGREEEEAVAEEEGEEKEDARVRLLSCWFSPGEVEKERAGVPPSWKAFGCRIGCAGTSGIPLDVEGESALNKLSLGGRAVGREGPRGASLDEGVSGFFATSVFSHHIVCLLYLVSCT